jgi:hypothetical protein
MINLSSFVFWCSTYVYPRAGSNRKLKRIHNEELHDLYSSPSTSIAAKLIKIRVSCVERKGETKCTRNFSQKCVITEDLFANRRADWKI